MMQKRFFRIIACFVALISLAFVGCGKTHKCSYTEKVESESYLKTEANCQTAKQYYYSCTCGKHGEETFTVGIISGHNYTAEVATDEYLKEPANCMNQAVYYKSCVICGKGGYSFQTFTYGELGECNFSEEVIDGKYLKAEATFTDAAVYYKSCVCGKYGEESFAYGEKLRNDYTDEEKTAYMPTSLTVTLYDAEESVYGFTYNTSLKPLRPVLQIAKGSDFSDFEEYSATTTQETSYNDKDEQYTYYIVKVEAHLEYPNTYTYRVYDKYVGVGTEIASLQTKNTKTTQFRFAHLSDSQVDANDKVGSGTGVAFGKVLSKIVGENNFIVHTGDVVEYSTYESYWKHMLHVNFSYLSTIPIMAVSGNHETTYRNGSDEMFKHFHYKIPVQESTKLGYFYSFVYGNAKFIMLNTNDLNGNALKTEQYTWLVNELENNTCEWTFVVLHNPIYSVGKYGADPSRNAICLGLRAQLQGIFAQYGVDVVLQAHDHTISRTYPIDQAGVPQAETFKTEDGVNYSVNPNGVIYVMNGPAGTQTRTPYAIDNDYYAYAESSNACSWAEFEIDGTKLTVMVKYTDGTNVNLYQTWGIEKQ